MTYVLINCNRKIFSFDPYSNSYYFAENYNEYQIEIIPTPIENLKQDEGRFCRRDFETLYFNCWYLALVKFGSVNETK